MTTEELAKKMNTEFSMTKWPAFMEVDHETYANVCHTILSEKVMNAGGYVAIAIGNKRGLMFKNVQLILTKKK